MAPIHDTDIAEKRWSEAEWKHYELWEKVEHRLKKRKWLWIGLTVVLFLVLSAVPILIDKWPKWMTATATRRLAQEINKVKRDANLHHEAFRLRFFEENLSFVVEKGPNCTGTQWTQVRTGHLLDAKRASSFTHLSRSAGMDVGIPGLLDSFCYDYLAGSEPILRGESVVGFALAPVKDMTVRRMDRVSLLLLTGPSAEISFD